MKKITSKLLFALTIAFASSAATAQIGIAVAKDKNGSSVQYAVSWNHGSKTESEARKILARKGYTKISTLTGGEKRGHKLKSGVYVIVEVRHKVLGKWKTSFGLGAAPTYAEAERRAVSNLAQYDWSWNKRKGYRVSRRGTFGR